MTPISFFEEYLKEEDFFDKLEKTKEDPVDVIIPVFNTNPLFEKNLKSFFREIPINRLLIGDAGCTDDTTEILKKFPRVKIIDQTTRNTLGYCIAELISNVETKWFIYLHADVYLPYNWYDIMKSYRNKYDWFESDRRILTMMDFDLSIKNAKRAYSGAQMGRKEAFNNIINKVDDDYLYRNEDIIFQQLILNAGFNYGRILDTFHFHQIMNKKGEKEPKIKSVLIEKQEDIQWQIKTLLMQVKGIIKYSKPKSYLIKAVNDPLRMLLKYKAINVNEFKLWVKETNKIWLKYLVLKESIISKLFNKFRKIRFVKQIYERLL